MKKLQTILCCLSFAIFGVGLAKYGLDPPSLSHAQRANASTPIKFEFPKNNTAVIDYSLLPKDLKMGFEQKASDNVGTTPTEVSSTVVDSLNQRIKQLEKTKQVTMIKWKRGPAPPPIVETKVVERHTTDTIQVPVYYLATQVGNKEEPTGHCIPIYEVRKIDEICPEQINSSTTHTHECDSNSSD